MKIFRGRNNDGADYIDIPEEHLFLGSCKGIALVPRGKNDSHICLIVLTEDDGVWFVSPNSFSSFWAKDLKTQLERAMDWMGIYADKDESGFGYTFRPSL